MAPLLSKLLTFALLSFTAAQHGSTMDTSDEIDEEMGPAAFMWPPDRVWSGDMDTVPPCGSRAAVGNRTEFPLTGGSVALVAQDDYYNTKISISYKSDPTTNTDFSTLIEEQSVADLKPGHTCVKIPDAPSSVRAGDNATLQIIYRADWDAPHNQTFYACADITYVLAANFKTRIPCFNATEPGDDDKAAASRTAGLANPTSVPVTGGGGGSSSGLSGGAIAGIVIGALAGVGLAAFAVFFLYRRSQQKKRNERLARMEENARREQWSVGKNSASDHSVKLDTLR